MITSLKNIIAKMTITFCNLLPVQKNKVFVFSYYGSQFGCSPKYITEYLHEHYPGDTFDIVWAFNDKKNKKLFPGMRMVKTMTLPYFYEMCTAKVIITNFRTTDLFKKRRGQYYIQTWHSSLRLKQIEKDAEDVLPKNYVEMAKKDSKKCDLLLSGCEFSTNTFKRAFWYNGEIFNHGTPRNDLLLEANPLRKERIKEKLSIPEDYNIVLYAPTFRKNSSLNLYNLDYSTIISNLSHKFGGKWLFLVKLHPHLLMKSKELSFGNDVMDVTSYDDIQELLSIADVLITDYSSLMFDYALTKRPCFLYVPDLDEYTSNERKLYFDINKLPFVSARSNSELLNKITNYHKNQYTQGLNKFLREVGTYEQGSASEKLAEKIYEVCYSEVKRRKGNEAV